MALQLDLDLLQDRCNLIHLHQSCACLFAEGVWMTSCTAIGYIGHAVASLAMGVAASPPK